MIAPSVSGRESKLYSAPRRFDLSTIIVVTGAFGGLLGLLRSVGVPPGVLGFAAGGFLCVGLGQALLFGGKAPRLASCMTGAALGVGLALVEQAQLPTQYFGWEYFLAYTLVVPACVGAFGGYLAGALVGSVFLISEAVRNAVAQPRDSDVE